LEPDNQIEKVINEELISEKIYIIRGQKVMLDKDLAELYEVGTKVLKQAVRRKIERFPKDFMFELTVDEYKILRSQFVTSSWGGTRYKPMAFTEQGVAMLSSVLNSKRAIKVNIQIIRVFTKLRTLLASHQEILIKLEQMQLKDSEQDEQILQIFEILKHLENTYQEEEDFRQRRRVGFGTEND